MAPVPAAVLAVLRVTSFTVAASFKRFASVIAPDPAVALSRAVTLI